MARLQKGNKYLGPNSKGKPKSYLFWLSLTNQLKLIHKNENKLTPEQTLWGLSIYHLVGMWSNLGIFCW